MNKQIRTDKAGRREIWRELFLKMTVDYVGNFKVKVQIFSQINAANQIY